MNARTVARKVVDSVAASAVVIAREVKSHAVVIVHEVKDNAVAIVHGIHDLQAKAAATRNVSTSLQLPTRHVVKAKAGMASDQPGRAIGQGSTTATGLRTSKVSAPRARSAARIGNLCRSNVPTLVSRITRR